MKADWFYQTESKQMLISYKAYKFVNAVSPWKAVFGTTLIRLFERSLLKTIQKILIYENSRIIKIDSPPMPSFGKESHASRVNRAQE